MGNVDREKEAKWERYKDKNFPPHVTGLASFRLNFGMVRAAYLAGLKEKDKS